MQHVSPGKQRNRMVCKSPVARTLEPNADFTMMILGNASGIKRLLRIDGRPEPHPPTNMRVAGRSEEHTSELQSLMRNSYAVFCLKKKKTTKHTQMKKSQKTKRIKKKDRKTI